MRGWWLNKSNTFCWQVESFGLEGRYWFGKRDNRRVLTGWFAGTFVSGGFYHFQLQKTKGIQGEFFILAGFSGGYSYKINRSLSLELSAGVGYVMNDYRHYDVEDDGLYRSSPNYRFQAILPAKAKVSLVWLIQSRKPLVTIGGESR